MKTTRNITLFIAVTAVLAAPTFRLPAQGVPGAINYQGRLLDDAGQSVTTPVTLTFTFWDAASDGAQLGGGWSDVDSVTPDSHGMYSTEIGDDPGNPVPPAIFDAAGVWLNVNVSGEDLAPRARLLTVPYAVKADKATTADVATTATTASGLTGGLTNPGDRVALGANVWLQVAADGTVEIVANGKRHRLGTERWTHPADLADNFSLDGANATDPQIAMSDNGDAIITWSQSDGSNIQILKSEYRKGAWTHPSGIADNISPDGEDATYPQVAMNANGEAVIAWKQGNERGRQQIFKSEYRNGAWTHPAGLTDNISSPIIWNLQASPQVALSDNGDALIVWYQFDGSDNQIFKSEYRGGSWDHPTSDSDNISPDGGQVRDPQVAMNANGEALIVWSQRVDSESQIYKSEYRSGVWTHPSNLADHISPAGGLASAPQVALSDNGDAVIVWHQSDSSRTRIFMSEHRSSVWSHPADLTDYINLDGGYAWYPQVALNASGDAVIVWQQGSTYKSEYRDGAWTHPSDLSDGIGPGGSTPLDHQVALSDNGDAAIVWYQSDGSNNQIFKSERRNGFWAHPSGPTDNISPDGQNAGYPQVALNANGDTVIVWQQSDGSNDQIFKSEYRFGF